MDLYTLNENFIAKDDIDGYISAIWTERFWSAGDCQLVVPAVDATLEKLKEGTFLALRGTKEVMKLDTVSIEDGQATIVGSTLVEFLNERYSWWKNPSSETVDDLIADYNDDTKKPGAFIADVVYKMAINPVDSTYPFTYNANLNWDADKIPHLSLGAVDASGVVKRMTLPIGPLYEGIQSLAEQETLGISLYLQSADPVTGYVLKFTTYQGRDHTTGSAYPLVRLSPDLESLNNIKEVRSIANYKNVCYVFYKGIVTTHLADPLAPVPEGFDRRVLVTNPDKEPVGHKVQLDSRYGYGTGIVVSPADIAAFREQNAKDALANHNYIHAVDGETSPISDYKFGADYGLGDIIELESVSGAISKARVTEYIRSDDRTGQKEYPTISVVS